VVDGQPPAQETDWGILEVMNLNMDPNPVIAVFLPATIRTLIPAPLGLYEPGLCALNRDTYLIHVPIDDHHTITYATQSVRIPKGMEEKYAAKHAAYDQSVQSRPPCELGQAILDGKLNFDDVAGHPMMVVIEDYVAQVGQGAIADREAEWLGRSDANIIQLRKIVARELDALAENRPTKRWTTLESTPDELQQQKETYRERGLY
jgi:5,5'-dehydrodivanillate O-demethylase oxygenase subunit